MSLAVMGPCPKCGGNFSEPRYENGPPTQEWAALGVGDWPERLSYACLRCGYVVCTPTDDAPKARERAS